MVNLRNLYVLLAGCGESDGHMADEYLKQEQDDALDVIAWAAVQPWCNGAGYDGQIVGGLQLPTGVYAIPAYPHCLDLPILVKGVGHSQQTE